MEEIGKSKSILLIGKGPLLHVEDQSLFFKICLLLRMVSLSTFSFGKGENKW